MYWVDQDGNPVLMRSYSQISKIELGQDYQF